jgi:hypothetical protein
MEVGAMAMQRRTFVEVRFSAPVGSFTSDDARDVASFKTEYVLKSGSRSVQMARDMGSQSKIVNDRAFTKAVRALLLEFARHVDEFDKS